MPTNCWCKQWESFNFSLFWTDLQSVKEEQTIGGFTGVLHDASPKSEYTLPRLLSSFLWFLPLESMGTFLIMGGHFLDTSHWIYYRNYQHNQRRYSDQWGGGMRDPDDDDSPVLLLLLESSDSWWWNLWLWIFSHFVRFNYDMVSWIFCLIRWRHARPRWWWHSGPGIFYPGKRIQEQGVPLMKFLASRLIMMRTFCMA